MIIQNFKVMGMTDRELKDIIDNGDKNTFLHFQAEREYNARHHGGRRRAEWTEQMFIEGMPEYSFNWL